MKTRFFVVILLLICSFQWANAQELPPDSPAYKRFPTIPPFKVLQVDSTSLTKDNLKKHQPTIIMYFSPDCEHCQHQWEDMEKRRRDLKRYQIVMITHQPFDMMKAFYNNHNIASHKNIKMGQDTKFFLPPFYRMQSLPFIALYDKGGNLITTFEGNVKIDKLLAAFKK